MPRRSEALITGLVGADVMLAMAGILMVVMTLVQGDFKTAAPDPAAHWVAMNDGLWLSMQTRVPLEAIGTATFSLPATTPVTLIVAPGGLDAAFLTELRVSQLGGREITLIRRSRACQPIAMADQRLSCAP